MIGRQFMYACMRATELPLDPLEVKFEFKKKNYLDLRGKWCAPHPRNTFSVIKKISHSTAEVMVNLLIIFNFNYARTITTCVKKIVNLQHVSVQGLAHDWRMRNFVSRLFDKKKNRWWCNYTLIILCFHSYVMTVRGSKLRLPKIIRLIHTGFDGEECTKGNVGSENATRTTWVLKVLRCCIRIYIYVYMDEYIIK